MEHSLFFSQAFSLRKCLPGAYFGGWLQLFPGCVPKRFIARVAQAADSGFVDCLLLRVSVPKTSHSHVFLIQRGAAGLLTTNNEHRPSTIKGLQKAEGRLLHSTVICSLFVTVAIADWTCSRILVGKSVEKLPQQTAPLGNVLKGFCHKGAICTQEISRGHCPSMMCHKKGTDLQ